MAVQEGFLYEQNAYKALKKPNLHKDIAVGQIAGASSNKPDITIKSGNSTSGVELKNQPTAAGSLVLQFHKGSWNFGPTDGKEEKEFLKQLGTAAGVLDILNSKWKTPILQYDNNGKKIYVGAEKNIAYRKDLESFGKLPLSARYIDVPSKAVCDYYNKKGSYYLNVGTRGFYTLNRDKLGLNSKLRKIGASGIPDFGDAATTKIRLRVQPKGGGDYQIVFTLQFSSISPSPFNIAPILKGSKSNIDKKALITDTLMQVL